MPKTNEMSIKELLDMYTHKEIQLPELQRKYVWRRKKIKNLLDSIYKDYPSGSILLWKTDEDIETREPSVTLKEERKIRDKFLLLDGQQRLTSLLASLRGEEIICKIGRKKVKQKVEIYFNLYHPEDVEFGGDIEDDEDDEDDEDENEQEWFQLKSKKIQNDKKWASVAGLITDESYYDDIIERIKNEKEFVNLNKRINKIKTLENSYSYPVVILPDSMSYEEVTDVFVRVNSAGARLTSAELALAQITAKWRGSLKIFEKFSEECGKDGFEISVPELMRILVSLTTNQNKFDIISKTSVEDLKSGWEITKESVQYTINFLKTAGIEKMEPIPSYNLLVPIAYIAHKENYELKKKRDLLLKWFFAAAMWARYSGTSESTLDVDLSIIQNNENYIQKMIEEIQTARGGTLTVRESDLEGLNSKSPMFFMVYVLARKNSAKDWRTGLVFSLDSSGVKYQNEIDHIFPQNVLNKFFEGKNMDSKKIKKLVNDLGNLAFLSKVSNIKKGKITPDVYFPGKIKEFGNEILTAQCIPTEASYWNLDNYDNFLKERRKSIADGINDLMQSLG